LEQCNWNYTRIAEPQTKNLLFEVKAATALFGYPGALQHLDEQFIKPWRVKIDKVTSGDAEVDSYIQRTGAQLGHNLNVATPQN
jgi:hypothetical protein